MSLASAHEFRPRGEGVIYLPFSPIALGSHEGKKRGQLKVGHVETVETV